jgi:ribosomal protein S18 acetylase RimI-like enzyme
MIPVKLRFEHAEKFGSESVFRLHEMLFRGIGETVEKLHSDLQTSTLYVAHSGAILIGYATVNFRTEEIAYMGWFGIDPNSRGQGIGRHFLEFIETEVKKMGRSSIEVDCRNRFSAALKMYRANGFVVMGTKAAPDGEMLIRLGKSL